jgi:hypothetical protein
MIKKLTSFLDYGMFAEIALAIFAFVFISIVIRTLMMKNETTQQQANVVFGDQEEPSL